MAISLEQREKMNKFVGASRIAAVLGHDPYKTAEEVRLEMLGLHTPKPAGERAWLGTKLEPSIVGMIAERSREPFLTSADVLEYEAANGRMICHPDAITASRLSMAEAKYSHLVQDWGDGSDAQALPMRVLLQVVGQLICVPEAQRVYVGALLISRDQPEFRLFTVERDAALSGLCTEVEASVLAWCDRHLDQRLPCPDAALSLDTLKAINRDPDAVVTLAPEWFDAALAANEERKAAEKREEEAMGALFAQIDLASHAEGLTVPAAAAIDNRGRKFWHKTENAGMRVDVDALKTQFGDVYLQVAKPSTRKMPRWYGLPKK